MPSARPPGLRSREADSEARRKRERSGHWSEAVAAAFLFAKGYRVIARRWKSPLGEIDLIVARGQRLAFVEVKRRRTMEDAQAAITEHQGDRIRRAADLWLARNSRYQNHEICFDAVFVLPRRWPQHVEDGF